MLGLFANAITKASSNFSSGFLSAVEAILGKIPEHFGNKMLPDSLARCQDCLPERLEGWIQVPKLSLASGLKFHTWPLHVARAALLCFCVVRKLVVVGQW
jgi:hypothetical protein